MSIVESTTKIGDDTIYMCASDLQHSAIYDNHVEMQKCIRAVTARMRALAEKENQELALLKVYMAHVVDVESVSLLGSIAYSIQLTSEQMAKLLVVEKEVIDAMDRLDSLLPWRK